MNKEKEFYYAVINNRAEELTDLMREEKDFCRKINPYNESLLYHAATKGHNEVVQLLLKNGCDPNSKNKKGYAPLHVAALYGFTDVAESLINTNATVDIEDGHGNTPLLEAVFNFKNEMGIITLLINNGANPLHKNRSGISPFDLAVDSKQEKIVQYFESLLLNK